MDYKPWDTHGRVLPGDFIRVLKGHQAGKEGFVKDTQNSSDLLVEETCKDSSQPVIISEAMDLEVPVQSVRAFKLLFTHVFIPTRKYLLLLPR
jgi:ribosomal protein L24